MGKQLHPKVIRSNKAHDRLGAKYFNDDSILGMAKEMYHHFVIGEQYKKNKILSKSEKKKIFNDSLHNAKVMKK